MASTSSTATISPTKCATVGEPRAHGGLGPVASCEAWNRDLREGHFDVVVVTPENLGTALLPVQMRWTASVGRRAGPAGTAGSRVSDSAPA